MLASRVASAVIRSSVFTHGSRRHNSMIPTLVSYFKDKGVIIPFAHKALPEDEYKRYRMYRDIKLGRKNKVKETLRLNPLPKEERDTLIDCVRDLKKQPYSVPNFLIGYWAGLGAWKTTKIYSGAWYALFVQDHAITLPLLAASSVPVAATYLLGTFGLQVVYDEFRSPYYDYDGIIRAINQSLTTDELKEKEDAEKEAQDELKKIEEVHAREVLKEVTGHIPT